MATLSAGLCVGARLRPGRWIQLANRSLAVALLLVTALWLYTTEITTPFSWATSLPLALCDTLTVVAAAALLTRRALLVELVWFWGLAGTLQALVTPDLATSASAFEFAEYVVAHLSPIHI